MPPAPEVKPSLFDRIDLRLSQGAVVDGLWIGGWRGKASAARGRIEEALGLIKQHDPRRYNRIRHDLSRIWVRLLRGPAGQFNASLRTCELDERHVLSDTTSVALIAADIVHEATHARIHNRGVRYEEALRPRIEAVCRGQEVDFARRLSDGAAIVERAESWDTAPATFWGNSAITERRLVSTIDGVVTDHPVGRRMLAAQISILCLVLGLLRPILRTVWMLRGTAHEHPVKPRLPPTEEAQLLRLGVPRWLLRWAGFAATEPLPDT